DMKLEPAEFEACRRELLAELERVRPERILAVGALAARALLGDRYTEMGVCNGMGFTVPDHGPDYHGYDAIVIPTWHPAAALRPGGEDRLAYTGAAIEAFTSVGVKLCPAVASTPPPAIIAGEVDAATAMAIAANLLSEGRLGVDTEGEPHDPI